MKTLKNVQAAEKRAPCGVCDKNAKLFESLADKLNIQFDVFQKSDVDRHFIKPSTVESCNKKEIFIKRIPRSLLRWLRSFLPKMNLMKMENAEHIGKKLKKFRTNYFQTD